MHRKLLVRTVAAACATLLAGAASASSVYPDFTVDTAAMGGGGRLGTFVSNDISGEYHEQLTFTSPTTFAVSLDFTAQGFNYDDTNAALSTSYSAAQTGLGAQYGLLAVLSGTGTYTTTGGVTSFSLTPGGAFSLVYDAGASATFAPPATPGGSYTINANGDTLTTLATGATTMGNGSESCTAPNLCGAFGQETSFALTSAGSSFFVSPTPFYGLSLQSGQLEGFPVVSGSTVTSSGSLNAVFTSAVPEPSSLAMFSLALVGLVVGRGRKRIRS